MKKHLRKALVYWVFGCLLSVTACVSTQKRLLDSDTSQLQLRSIQTRAFDTTDQERTLRTVLVTLQDLGFMLDAGEVGLGTVSGVKWVNIHSMRITVSVRPRGETQMLVRANFQIERKPVQDPLPYQRFFAALSKALFLEAHQVE